MARPTPLSGFPELLPAARLAEQQVLDSLRGTFELHGFGSVETRAVEPLDQLLRKGETDKEVYVLRRLHADEDDGSSSAAGLGLHFDLTVPLARYVLEHAGRLEFPFRRYQVQRCWRGERPQEGRYREFTQADIDVVGRDVLPFDADVEVAEVMASALSGLPVPPLRLQVNNRKLIEGFYRGLGLEDPETVAAAMRAVDKLDKVGERGVHDLLTGDCGLAYKQADLCLALAGIVTDDASFATEVRELGVQHPLLDEGVDQLAQVVRGAAGAGGPGYTVTADLRIARGLDYYTGTVFETRMTGFESLGSVCSGGRYDALASDDRSTYPGVGISFGVTRTIAPLVARGLLTASRSVPSAVLVALPDEGSRPDCRAVAGALRARGINTELSPDPAKYGKQIRYAERRGIPYVWFPGRDGAPDQVKDIRSGKQVEADAGAWLPPAVDLHPQIVSDLTEPTHDPQS